MVHEAGRKEILQAYVKVIILYDISFCGSLQDYKIHMDMKIVSIIYKSKKLLKKSRSEVSIKVYNYFGY